MTASRLTRLAAGLHLALAIAAVYYTLRINNHAELSDISLKEVLAMGGIVALPLVYAALGSRAGWTETASWFLATGQVAALVAFAATFVVVVRSVEPMAPLLFLLVSLYLAAALSVLLLFVFIAGRFAR